MTITIPPKEREEWSKMISGEIEHKFHNYVLQLRIYQLRKEISQGHFSMDKAVDELYGLCQKYAMAVQSDFKVIFKKW